MSNTHCPVCGKHELREEITDFRAEFKDDSGGLREVVVKGVRKNICEACGEYFFDEPSEEKISVAQRAAMGLLSADKLQAFRKSLGKSQEQMSELLGLGKRTWCRWESNDHFQSESFDRYLRLLMFAPANVRALETLQLWKDRPDSLAALSERFPHVSDVEAAHEFETRFEAILKTGPFSRTTGS